MDNFPSFWVVLNNIRYRFRFVKASQIPSDRVGDCDVRPPYTIRVRHALKKQVRMDTIIHEAIHAMFPKLGEKKVFQSAKELANLLWRCGYRRVEQ